MNIRKYLTVPCHVLDVGSLNYKNKKGNYLGCYKEIVPLGFEYTGIDLVFGENVDVVMKDPYSFPFEDSSFGAIITGQCFEHVKNPFRLMKECSRVLKNGGYFLGVAPYKWEIHRCPVDCWRILSDGWISLFEESNLKLIDVYLNENNEFQGDSWGIAKK